MQGIGNKIRKVREWKNYTQEHVAHALGVSSTAYGKMERDETNVSIERLQEIAKVLEIDYKLILDLDDKVIFNISQTDFKNSQGVSHNCQINPTEIHQQFIQQLQSEIAHLRQENTKLMELLGKKN